MRISCFFCLQSPRPIGIGHGMGRRDDARCSTQRRTDDFQPGHISACETSHSRHPGGHPRSAHAGKTRENVVRGTGFHLRDGYVITARHAAEKHNPSTGTIIQKHVRMLTSDLNELPADLVGDSAFMDAVIYRVAEPHRSKLQAGTSFATGEAVPGMEVFAVGYPLAGAPPWPSAVWETRTPSSKLSRRLIQADLSACSGNSGGGLFNAQGNIVGIIHAIIQTKKKKLTAHLQPHDLCHSGDSRRADRECGALRQTAHVLKNGDSDDLGEGRTKWRMAVKDVADPAKKPAFKSPTSCWRSRTGDSRRGPTEELSDRTDHSGRESQSKCDESMQSDVHSQTGRRIAFFRGTPDIPEHFGRHNLLAICIE